MKRELLAKSLQQMGSKEPEPTSDSQTATPRALKSMKDVLSQVSSQSAQEIDVSEIADSAVSDRFDIEDGLSELIESIRSSGQQLPAMLRYRKGHGPRYEVVYGRRRIAACRSLGIKVKAYVKDMDEREALVSQALENSARLERSFIEQAVFATRLEEQDFDRAQICEVLAVDKGTLSKLISVARDVPDRVIYKIGAAHDAGRRPWLELRRLVKSDNAPNVTDLLKLVPQTGTPTEKLTGLIAALKSVELAASDATKQATTRATAKKVKGAQVSFKATSTRLTVEAKEKTDQEFISYLEGRLSDLYHDWKKTNPGVDHKEKS